MRQTGKRRGNGGAGKVIILVFYFILLFIPIYWMLNTSFKSNTEIQGMLTLFPAEVTGRNYLKIFTDPLWVRSFIQTIGYVVINVAMVLAAAIPAAYAFSRLRFRGQQHLFFWLLTNRMAPGAAFLVPMFTLFSSLGLFDTMIAVSLAHCLFNLPLAIWILEGFMRGIPREIDETAFIDGYSFPRFFWKIFVPLIKQGVGVTAFFCFMFSWVELLLCRTLTSVGVKPVSVALTRSLGAGGWDYGVIAAAGVLTMIPGAVVVYFVRNYIVKGFAMGRV
jgi:glycerol transport system permease protein